MKAAAAAEAAPAPLPRKEGLKGRMDPEDFVPCTRCGLRGHVAGDPDRCITGIGRSTGLGQAAWMGGGQ